jgi:hypothetical protein
MISSQTRLTREPRKLKQGKERAFFSEEKKQKTFTFPPLP